MAGSPKGAYHLTDAEKRGVTQFIQRGKTLPEHIYIDPLFDVGADFSTDIEISGHSRAQTLSLQMGACK